MRSSTFVQVYFLFYSRYSILYNLSHLRFPRFPSLLTSLLPAVFLLLFFPHPSLLFRCFSSSFCFLFLLICRCLLFLSCLSSCFCFFSISSSFLLLPVLIFSLISSLPFPSLLFSFVMFSSSIDRFFLSFSFFFSLSYPNFIFCFRSLLSFFSFLFLYFAFCSFTSHLLVMLLRSVVSFSFLLSPLPPVFLRAFFSLHLPLYSSAVLLFQWRFAFCSRLVGNPASGLPL